MIELQLYYIPECDTDKAICVCEDVPDHIYGVDQRFFLPLSQIEIIKTRKVKTIDCDVEIRTQIITILCKEWLAKQKGLV
jgi:hypothetical protein